MTSDTLNLAKKYLFVFLYVFLQIPFSLAKESSQNPLPKEVTCEINMNKQHQYKVAKQNSKEAIKEVLDTCYEDYGKNDLNKKALCRVMLACSSDSQPPTRVYKSINCNTKSNGISYSYLDIVQNNVKKTLLKKCNANENSNEGECNTNLECQGKRVGPAVAECKASTNNVIVTEVDIYLDSAKQRALSLCEENDGIQPEQCNETLKCELFDNEKGLEFKSSIILKK